VELKASLSLTEPASLAMQGRQAVQKHTAVNPEAIHSKERRLPRMRVGAPVFCGLEPGADAPKSLIRSEAMKSAGQLEEVAEVIFFDVAMDPLFALPVHEADLHLMGMQIDSAVELCGGGIILHRLMQ
jgi:hypothetical protein